MEIEKVFEIMANCSTNGERSIHPSRFKGMCELRWTYPNGLQLGICVSYDVIGDSKVLTVYLVKKVHEFEQKARQFHLGG